MIHSKDPHEYAENLKTMWQYPDRPTIKQLEDAQCHIDIMDNKYFSYSDWKKDLQYLKRTHKSGKNIILYLMRNHDAYSRS